MHPTLIHFALSSFALVRFGVVKRPSTEFVCYFLSTHDFAAVVKQNIRNAETILANVTTVSDIEEVSICISGIHAKQPPDACCFYLEKHEKDSNFFQRLFFQIMM
jgi:hypothetical protein